MVIEVLLGAEMGKMCKGRKRRSGFANKLQLWGGMHLGHIKGDISQLLLRMVKEEEETDEVDKWLG